MSIDWVVVFNWLIRAVVVVMLGFVADDVRRLRRLTEELVRHARQPQ